MTRHVQFAILGAGGLLAILAPGLLQLRVRAGVQPAQIRSGPLHPVMHIPRAIFGGLVSEVLVQAGQHVEAGQLLLRFDAKELESRIAQLQQAARTAQATITISEIPPQARQYVFEVHPDTMQAEREYVDALAVLESAAEKDRAAAATRLQHASQERGLVRGRLAANMSSAASGEALRGFLEQTTRSIAEAQRLLQETGVRAPANAVVDLIEVHAGERLPPGAALAILVSDMDYSLELPIAAAEAARLHAGMKLKGRLEGKAQPVEALLETITAHKVPVIARENLQIGEESILKLRFHSAAPLRPGLLAAMELP